METIRFLGRLRAEKNGKYTKYVITVPSRIARYLEPGEYLVILVKKE